jgi:hypothetical protein
MKIKAAKMKSEKMDEDKEMKVGDTKKTRTGELTKTSTGVIHKNTSYHDDGDEIASNAKSGKGIKSHAKAQSAAEKKEKAPAQKMSPKSAKTWGMSNSEKFDNRDKVDEAKAKCCCEEPKKTTCPVHGKIDEAKQTMSRAAKGVMKYGKDGMQALAKAGKEGKSLEPVKAKYNKYDEAKELKGGQKKLDKNHNGKLDSDDFKKLRAERKVDEADMGKHNNGKTTGFKAVANKAAKEYGSKAAGERVAGAIKAKMAKAGKLEETVSPEKMKIRESIARAKALLEAGKSKGKPKWLEKAEVEAEEKSGKKVSKAEEKKVGIVKESVELDRLKFLTKQLNG